MIHNLAARILTLAAITLILSLTGCRSSKESVPGRTDDLAYMPLNQRAIEVAGSYQPWEQINVPVKISVKSPRKMSVSGRLYMRRDRDIYITLRVLGMEVANIYVDRDSVFAADRLHKYYIAEPISDIFAGADLTVGDLQDAMLGRCFINSRGTFNPSMLRDVTLGDSGDGSWTLTPRSRIKGNIGYRFCFSDTDNTLTSLIIETSGKQYGCSYSLPFEVDGSLFMQRLCINTAVGKTQIDATVTYDFDKVKWEVPQSVRRRTYDNYRRLSPSNIIKAFGDK